MLYFITGLILFILGFLCVFDCHSKNIKRALLIGLILAILPTGCGIASVTTGIYPDYASGDRVGYVVKLENAGIFWKTYEGSMHPGHDKKSSLEEAFDFSVYEIEVVEKIQTALVTGHKVKLIFRSWIHQPEWRGKSSIEVIDVEFLE